MHIHYIIICSRTIFQTNISYSKKKVIKTISEDQKLGQLMNENKTDKNVSRKTILKN